MHDVSVLPLRSGDQSPLESIQPPEKICPQSFRHRRADWRVIVESRWLCPELRTTALATQSTVRPGSAWTAGLPVRSRNPFNDELVALAFLAGAHAIGPHHHGVNPKLIREAHAAAMRVLPWTVNRRWTMHALIDLGVDGIVTDRPGRLRDVLAVRDYELPPPVADELARAA